MTMAMVIITVMLLMEVSYNMSVGVRSDFVVSPVSVCGQLSVQQAVTAADVQQWPMNDHASTSVKFNDDVSGMNSA